MFLTRFWSIALIASAVLLPENVLAQFTFPTRSLSPPVVLTPPTYNYSGTTATVQQGPQYVRTAMAPQQPIQQFGQQPIQFNPPPIIQPQYGQPGIGLPAPYDPNQQYVQGQQPIPGIMPYSQPGLTGAQPYNPYSTYQPLPGINGVAGENITPRFGGGTLWMNDVGLEDGYTYLHGFLPVFQNPGQNILFLDTRAIKFHDSSEAFGLNFHGGYRWMTPASRILGVYAGYDLQDTGPFDFHQLSFGGESLGRIVDFRANGYILLSSDSKFVSLTNLMYTGNNLVGTANYLDAFSGFDAEVGLNLTPDRPGLDLRIFGGGYGFLSNGSQDAWGARGRVEAKWWNNVTLGASVQNDAVFDTTYNFTLSLLFGGSSRANRANPYCGGNICERLGDPLHKNMHVVLGPRSQQTIINNPADNMPLEILHIDSNAAAGGAGTFESPDNTLVNNPAANYDIVLVHGGSFFSGQNITIDDAGQRLLGDGASVAHTTNSQFGTIALPRANAFAAQPNIDLAPNPAVTIAANNVEVAGLNITRAAGNGIVGNNISGFNVNRNTIDNSGNFGVNLAGTVNGTLSSNVVTNSASNGVTIGNWNGGLIDGNTVNNNGFHGIQFENISNGSIRNNRASGNVQDGFFVNNTISGGSIIGNFATGNGDVGFDIENMTGGLLFNNTASGNTTAGFEFDNTVSGGTISKNSSSGNGTRGFNFATVSGGTISGNIATGNTSAGYLFNNVTNGTINGNRSTGNGASGYQFNTFSGGTFSSNFAGSNTTNGVFFTSVTGGLIDSNISNNNTTRGFNVVSFSGGTLSNNSASGNGVDGFFFTGVSGGLIDSNLANMNTFDGFDINAFTGGLFNNNVSNNNTDQGYEVTGAVAPASATNNTGSGNAGGNTFSFPP